ncbi:SpoIIE family protein phosphatase [Algivirga pacifica]|uniref:HAMP domain-containing protein n=1 Tax=Algivirga pacifica TaxID=1162670 RepID=A0ABP9DCM0_9BACT
MKYLRSIKSKLYFSFFIFLLIAVSLAVLNLWLNEQRNDIEQTILKLHQLQNSIQTIQQVEKDFLTDEVINADFYTEENSNIEKRLDHSVKAVFRDIAALKNDYYTQSNTYESNLSLLENNILQYERRLSVLFKTHKEKGFENYGLIGEMRRYIHTIEEAQTEGSMVTILLIRRHEKDFFLRKEDKYIDRLLQEVKNLELLLKASNLSKTQETSLLTYLHNYKQVFKSVVALNRKIGINRSMGIRAEIIQVRKTIDKQMVQLSTKIQLQTDQERSIVIYSFLLFTAILLSIGIYWIYRVTIAFGKPIKVLSQNIQEAIQHNFEGVYFPVQESDDELGQLSRDFHTMQCRIQESLADVKNHSNNITQQNNLLLDSLRYGNAIQAAMLPKRSSLLRHFKDSFVIYRPQQLVSGDFYWMIKRKQRLFVAVVDCTGHGVPGAFMSMIGMTLLNKIISQRKIFNPAQVLEVLDHEVKEALQQHEKDSFADGMDIALCMLEQREENSTKYELTFAGAKRPVLLRKNNQVVEIKGSNRAIGGHIKRKTPKPFVNHQLTLSKKDRIYLFTDGYADQNNHERKKIGRVALYELIHKTCWMDFNTQKERLELFLEKHQGEEKQRDDITILGVELE